MSEVRHDPTYLHGGRRYWASCSCGWRSDLYRTLTSAMLTHGQHLLTVADPRGETGGVG